MPAKSAIAVMAEDRRPKKNKEPRGSPRGIET
jgi:hypothetical protein